MKAIFSMITAVFGVVPRASVEGEMRAACEAGMERAERDIAMLDAHPITVDLLMFAGSFRGAIVSDGKREAPIDRTCINAAALIASQAERIKALEEALGEASAIIAEALKIDDHYDARGLLDTWLHGGLDAIKGEWPEVASLLNRTGGE